MKIKTSKSKLLAHILMSIILLFGISAFAQKTNYSGTWNFNETLSQLGEGRFRTPASKMVITQSDTILDIEKTSKDMNGSDALLKEKYSFSDKVSENTGFMNTVKKSTLVWTADNNVLTINSTSVFERDGNSMEIKTTEVFLLSTDGKVLTINSTSISPRGERKQSIVYVKAE
jgi:hypothetical protein